MQRGCDTLSCLIVVRFVGLVPSLVCFYSITLRQFYSFDA
jgi:hypothetical protein